jgi:hypothetical protein
MGAANSGTQSDEEQQNSTFRDNPPEHIQRTAKGQPPACDECRKCPRIKYNPFILLPSWFNKSIK